MTNAQIRLSAILFNIPYEALASIQFADLTSLLSHCFSINPSVLKSKMSKEQVVAAYNLFLDRNPESPEVVEQATSCQFYDRVRDFCHSQEFIQKNLTPIDCSTILPQDCKFDTALFIEGNFTPNGSDIFSFKHQLSAGSYFGQGSFLLDDTAGNNIEFSISHNDVLLAAHEILINRQTQIAEVDFVLPYEGEYTFSFAKKSGLGDMLPRIFAVAEKNNRKNRQLLSVQTNTHPLTQIDVVIFGSTSICNSSCEHCPVNKEYHPTPASSVMDFDLFKKIVMQLASFKVKHINFGLYNESLTDPLLNERILCCKETLPSTLVQINTNAALFSEKHHEAIRNADIVNIQVSAYSPDVYKKVMHPLNFERTYEKIHKIISLAHTTTISVPISQTNISECKKIQSYWLDSGAKLVHFDALSNRCGELPNFDDLTVAKAPGICRADALKAISIDYDGKVVNCCQDFLRREILGDLSVQTLEETLSSSILKQFMNDLDAGLWGLHNCRYCKYDNYKKVQELCNA